MCFAEVSNKEIAEELGVKLTDVHAARSRLGLTIPKVKAMMTKDVKASARTKAEIIKEIEKVRKSWNEALKKEKRCNERIGQLYKELEG